MQSKVSKTLPRRIAAIICGVVGLLLFRLFDLPLPFLLGPIFACLIAALLRVPISDLGPAHNLMRTILGVAIGAAITPQFFEQASDMLASLALVPLFVAAIGLTGYPYFRYLCGFDHATSYYSAMPGGIQDMLVFGEEAGADARALSLVHATRVLVIVTLVPIVLTYLWGLDFHKPPGKPAASIPVPELVLMAVLAVGGWQIAKYMKLFGASILGPLLATAVASLAGLIHFRPPAEAIFAAQFFIGLGVGVKYRGITAAEVRTVVAAGLGYCVILMVVAVSFAAIVVLLGFAPAPEAILAFSPGGQAEMVVLAIVAGADLTFVVTHHLLRIFMVILGAPVVARLVDVRNNSKG